MPCLSIRPCMQGHLCCFYADNYYQLCQRHPEVPRLTPLQEAAFAEFNRLAGSDELRMDYKLQPGDIQLLHNHSMVHCRSGFQDHQASMLCCLHFANNSWVADTWLC